MLNEALQKARINKGYTLKEMAKLLGYKSKASYFNIENNKVKITLKLALKISKILEKPIEELFQNFFGNEVQETETNQNSINFASYNSADTEKNNSQALAN